MNLLAPASEAKISVMENWTTDQEIVAAAQPRPMQNSFHFEMARTTTAELSQGHRKIAQAVWQGRPEVTRTEKLVQDVWIS